jgi:hypothetical protein
MLDFNVNPRGIACEHFDDETIILNLPKGNYYSLKASGQFIWTQLEKGANSGRVVSQLSEYYGISENEARLSLESFLDQLLQEELIVPATSFEATIQPVDVSNTSNQTFTIPVLEVYSDMQELLMLDPIHDADPGKGWPHQNNA